MTTRRSVRNQIEQLTDDDGAGDETQPLIMNMAFFESIKNPRPAKEEAEHPELVVQRWPDKKPGQLDYTTPNYLPERYMGLSFLTVCGDTADKHGFDPESQSGTVHVKTLWDELSDDDLRREYEYRVEHGDPIPDILQPYASD